MGLLVTVFRNAHCDCSNHGLSAQFATLCVINMPGDAQPDAVIPAVVLKDQTMNGLHHFRLEPVYAGEEGWQEAPGFMPKSLRKPWLMYGGNVAMASSQKWSDHLASLGCNTPGPVHIHDRIE